MTISAKKEYAGAILDRYLKAKRKTKTKILDEYTAVTGCHRKHAIRRLHVLTGEEVELKKRGRRNTYGFVTRTALITCWRATGCICAERLQPFLTELTAKLKHFGHLRITTETEKELLTLSVSTAKRIIKSHRRLNERSQFSTTKPGLLLKSQIPIQTKSWDQNQAGFLEVDLVAHCGNSLSGDFIYTLNSIDIKTGWTEKEAVLGKSQARVFAGLQKIETRLPFPLRGLDSDNGEEFINWHLFNYCDKNAIVFTRSRPYKKNDNAHIEQKNWTTVRQVLGYLRYETSEQLDLMNQLYRNELRLFQNFFQPTLKLVEKKRVGAKIVKKYAPATTPFRRVLECAEIAGEQKRRLSRLYDTLDPIALQQAISKTITRITNPKTQSHLPSSTHEKSLRSL